MPELHALRLVEMQLTSRAPAPETPYATTTTTSGNPVLDTYEARRCAVCGSKYPPFGFGPPLTRPHITVWACAAHRVELDARLSRGHTDAEPRTEQLSLL